MTNEEINAAISETRKQPWDETRCRICGWPVKASHLEGCTVNHCSMVPRPHRRADDNSRDWTGSEDASAVLRDELCAKFTTLIRQPDYVRVEPTLGKYYEGRGDWKRAIATVWLAWKGKG